MPPANLIGFRTQYQILYVLGSQYIGILCWPVEASSEERSNFLRPRLARTVLENYYYYYYYYYYC